MPKLFFFLFLSAVHAQTTLHGLFSEHSVLQHGQPVNIWGDDTPQQRVTVAFAGQSVQTTTDSDGQWLVTLEPLEISKEPQTLRVTGSSEIERRDLLVGDVWLLSGQSNMEWKMRQFTDHDIELLTADIPSLRLITISNPGSQEPQEKIVDQWAVCSKETAYHFSAVGFHFGKFLTDVVDLPIGLICNAWGGSAAETWLPRATLRTLPGSADYLKEWGEKEQNYPRAKENFEKALAKWEREKEEAAQQGKPFERKRPGDPAGPMRGAHRPGNLWNGRIWPLHQYGLQGVLWYQGETNAKGHLPEERAHTYRELFPALVKDWRAVWGGTTAKEDTLPFYWVNLASHRVKPAFDLNSEWATLRESQTASLSLINTGEALAIDLGEAEGYSSQ